MTKIFKPELFSGVLLIVKSKKQPPLDHFRPLS